MFDHFTTFVLEETRGANGVGGVSVRVACSVFLFVCRGGVVLRGWGCGVQDLGFSSALNPKPGGKL